MIYLLFNLLFSDRRPQVHITLGDIEGTSMIVSWVTANELGSSTVFYSEASPDPYMMELWAEGTHTRYNYFNYTSGFIHHCNLTNLKVSQLPIPCIHLLCNCSQNTQLTN
jgi:hypothetical protein